MIRTFLFVVLIVSAASAADPPVAKLPPAAKGTIDFAHDIRPILERSCLKCHGPDKQKGGLRLDDAKSALAGGNSGPVILPGDKAAESRLLVLVAGLDAELKMPPDGPALSAEDVGKLRAWIEQGAKFGEIAPIARHETQRPLVVPTHRGRHTAVNSQSEIRNPQSDRQFHPGSARKENLSPSPEADRPTLLRRLCSRPARLAADARSNGRVRARPRAGRLRAAGRAAAGESALRRALGAALARRGPLRRLRRLREGHRPPWAWHYRDWVIDALNRDLPFDQFTIEQLAGDLLPDATSRRESATGFHRNTLTNQEGGVDAEQFRVEQVVDRVNTTGKCFSG